MEPGASPVVTRPDGTRRISLGDPLGPSTTTSHDKPVPNLPEMGDDGGVPHGLGQLDSTCERRKGRTGLTLAAAQPARSGLLRR